METKLTLLIFTFNSAHEIAECIQSGLQLTKNIVVIDLESTDDTVQIALKNNAKVISHPHVPYVEQVREFAIKQIFSDWIFLLDADERITKELSDEIKKTIKDTKHTHFLMHRKNVFAKKVWLKHGGWWPDNQIRLIQKNSFQSWPKRIHAPMQINGSSGTLKEAFLHYFHGDLEEMVKKTVKYEDIEANLLYRAGRGVDTPIFFRKFLGELYRRLIANRGFLDGTVGIIESIYQAYSKTITYLFLYEKKKSRSL